MMSFTKVAKKISNDSGLQFVYLVVISVLVLFTLIPVSPAYSTILERDSGVYQYASWRMLNGDVIYRDIWDHKPPFLYLINLLGFSLFGISEWSIWLVEGFSIIITLLLFYKAQSKVFPKMISNIGTIFLLLAINFLGIVNNPELFALTFQVLIIYIFFQPTNRIKSTQYLIIGFLTGCIFYIKQSCMGIGLISILLLLYNLLQKKTTFKIFISQLGLFIIGFLIPSIGVFYYFIKTDALKDFWSAAFLYNMNAQTNSSIISKVEAIIYGIVLLSKTAGLALFAISGWIISVNILVAKKQTRILPVEIYFYSIIGLIVESSLTGLSSFKYPHYYITLLPVLCISADIFWFHVISDTKFESVPVLRITPTIIWTIPILMTFLSLNRLTYWPFCRKTDNSAQQQITDYIISHSGESDTVLLLGAESRMNYLTKRKSPTKYVYQYPITNSHYFTEDMIDNFYYEVEKNKPVLIIDTKNEKILNWTEYRSDTLYSIFSKNFFLASCHQDLSAVNLYKWDIYICNWDNN